MYPPVFQTVATDPAVQAVLGIAPVRVFPFGQAPDEVAMPYCVWQTVSGVPANYLGNTPDMDEWLVQFDVYAETASSARGAAEALRDAIEEVVYITAWRGESKEGGVYRYSFDANFISQR